MKKQTKNRKNKRKTKKNTTTTKTKKQNWTKGTQKLDKNTNHNINTCRKIKGRRTTKKRHANVPQPIQGFLLLISRFALRRPPPYPI